jgi:hypothetical protein
MHESVDLKHHWLSHIHLIPDINFPSHWNVRLVAPYGGALVRFVVNGKVSVYFDVDGSLSSMRVPHWEVAVLDDPDRSSPLRFLAAETKELIEAINGLL